MRRMSKKIRCENPILFLRTSWILFAWHNPTNCVIEISHLKSKR